MYEKAKWLVIRELDPHACLSYDGESDQWYISSDIRISDGPGADDIIILPGVGSRSETPDGAIDAMWRLLTVDLPAGRFVHVGQDDRRNLLRIDDAWVDQPQPASTR